MTPEPSRAPWTCEQVVALNHWQRRGDVHPFTCGGEDCREVLIADHEGWHCPACDYTQKWAHAVMTKLRAGEPSRAEWQALRERLIEELKMLPRYIAARGNGPTQEVTFHGPAFKREDVSKLLDRLLPAIPKDTP